VCRNIVGVHLEQPPYLTRELAQQREFRHRAGRQRSSRQQPVVSRAEMRMLVREHRSQLRR
jgi:hypothetical protein